MPYPNFHAARLRDPDSFVRIRVIKTTPDGIYFYGGPLKSKPNGPIVLQTIRFKVSKWTVKQAKEWLKEHKHKYIMFEKASNKE